MQIRIKHLVLLLIGALISMPGLSPAQQQSPVDIALRHLEQNLDQLNLTDADIANFYVSDLYTSKHNGVTHVYLIQQHNDIILRNAIINVNILPEWKSIEYGKSFCFGFAISGQFW